MLPSRPAGGFSRGSAAAFLGALALVAAGLGLFSWSGEVTAAKADAAGGGKGTEGPWPLAGKQPPPQGASSPRPCAHGSGDGGELDRLSSDGEDHSPAVAELSTRDGQGRGPSAAGEAGVGGGSGEGPLRHSRKQAHLAGRGAVNDVEGGELQPLWSHVHR